MLRGQLRRKDRAMETDEAWRFLEAGFHGRIGTADADGWPYIVPLVYAAYDGQVWFHHTMADSHLSANLRANPRVCFEVDRPGIIFPSGEHGPCDTSIGYESVIAFGTCREVEDPDVKLDMLRRVMDKYADPAWVRPDVWPALKGTAVYAISVERITGKRRPVQVAERWRDQVLGK